MAQQSNEPETHFIHTPLDESKRQIRLLQLQNDLSESEIRCQIEIFNIEDAPPYAALSYMWGDPLPTHTILLNGVYHLWIDYICIDQSNIRERNHQVRLMSNIYEQSTFVIAWLGYNAEEIEVVKQARDTADVTHLLPLLYNPYFRRIWIVQEVLLAPEVLVVCGHCWVSEYEMCLLARISPPEDIPTAADAIFVERSYNPDRPGYITSSSQSEGVRPKPTFADRLIDFGKNQCADIHDKVYGFLGLSTGVDIEVDYSKSISETFLEALAAVADEIQHTARPNPCTIFQILALQLGHEMQEDMQDNAIDLETTIAAISARYWASGGFL
ncbi:hypothetical protein EK21DRAFT_107749 [Setomelanomma holmii]|uniref:Heterokaryon incompatibility domain-containing protein n=1 Tax=Setomelanomma holmii TaxID=210430 RepID=A0A9P4LTC4_9PLEO|nr:hypothetical protein EK21DRAFT_107749 [Setomelanomma holmii]